MTTRICPTISPGCAVSTIDWQHFVYNLTVCKYKVQREDDPKSSEIILVQPSQNNRFSSAIDAIDVSNLRNLLLQLKDRCYVLV